MNERNSETRSIQKFTSLICYKCLDNKFKTFHKGNSVELYSCPKCGISWHFQCMMDFHTGSLEDLKYFSQLYCANCKFCGKCRKKRDDVFFLIKCFTCARYFHEECLDTRLKRKTRRAQPKNNDYHTLTRWRSASAYTSVRTPWQCLKCVQNRNLFSTSTNLNTKIEANGITNRNRSNNNISSFNSYFDCVITEQDKAIFKEVMSKTNSAQKSTLDSTVENQCLFPFEIQFGNTKIKSRYSSPYSSEYNTKKIFICPLCLTSKNSQMEHSKCYMTYPPGNEIYRFNQISLFEVDGEINPTYCRQLCLLAKLWIGEKAVYFEVEAFYFYILTKREINDFYFIGYFSKEKKYEFFNLACIMIMPQYRRQGYGKFLIDFSYLLARMKGNYGTPEKPLSEMGELTYLSYWTSAIIEYFNRYPSKNIFYIDKIKNETGIIEEDIIFTLKHLKILNNNKKSKTFTLDRSLIKTNYVNIPDDLKIRRENVFWSPKFL